MTTYRLDLAPILAGALCATAVLLVVKYFYPPLSWVIVASPVGLLLTFAALMGFGLWLAGAKFYK